MYGDFDPLLQEHLQIFAYTRTLQSDNVLVVLNFSTEEVTVTIDLPSSISSPKELVLSNYDSGTRRQFLSGDTLKLRGYEGLVYL